MLKARSVAWLFFLAVLSAAQISCDDVSGCAGQVNDTQEKLLKCVTVAGVREHLVAFRAIADDYSGNRAAGTPGYEASVDYVIDTLAAAGYEVTRHSFEFTFEPPNVLQQHEPSSQSYAAGSIIGTGFGEVSGPVIPVDLALGEAPWPAGPAKSTSGCEASDFTGLDFSGASEIALLQDGGCLLSVKARNAAAAGAEAAIILIKDDFNIKMGLPVGNASLMPDARPSNVELPLVAVSIKHGLVLAQEGSEALVSVPLPAKMTQFNVLAELPGDEIGSVVMVGGHLDSVFSGPGMSDNASGSAAILETAVQMAKVKPHHTVRFAWWGAEEVEPGRVGSEAYVASLTQEEVEAIALYLNFDMIGSPNYVFFVYDGEASDDLSVGGRSASSADITTLFASFYSDRGLPYERLNPDRHSDYAPFLAKGIPVGALLTGAEGRKAAEQASIFGGIAGESYDPCYHQPCDTVDNVNMEALEVNADAVAMATLFYAMKSD